MATFAPAGPLVFGLDGTIARTSRDGSSVVVTVRREGGRTTYTVYGALVAG